MKNLQKSQTTDSNNVITISTGHTSTHLNNSSSNSNSNNIDEFAVKPRIATTIQTITPKVMTTSNGTSTMVNLTGPVTDL